MRKLFLFLSTLAFIPAAASAGTASNGFVTSVYAIAQGAVVFRHSGTHSSAPTCGASEPDLWAIDATTAAGQAMVSTLLSAYAQHKAVSINGYGYCSIWGAAETVYWVYMQN